MKDCIEAICSRCTYRWQCGPFNECVPKKILLNEMSYREAIPVTIKTVVLADGTKYKDCLCSKCGKHFSLENIFDEEAWQRLIMYLSESLIKSNHI